MAAPGWHLLLGGTADGWPQEIRQLGHRYSSLLTVHHLTRQETPGVLYDSNGTAMHRLGLNPRHIALYLVRPDGHVGFRAGGPERTGLVRYLDRWLPARQPM